MTDITKTRLYRSLKPCIRKEDHAELRRMLRMVWDGPSSGLWSPNKGRLSEVFAWWTSPQGGEYWNTLSKRLIRAGYGEVA